MLLLREREVRGKVRSVFCLSCYRCVCVHFEIVRHSQHISTYDSPVDSWKDSDKYINKRCLLINSEENDPSVQIRTAKAKAKHRMLWLAGMHFSWCKRIVKCVATPAPVGKKQGAAELNSWQTNRLCWIWRICVIDCDIPCRLADYIIHQYVPKESAHSHPVVPSAWGEYFFHGLFPHFRSYFWHANVTSSTTKRCCRL